jgi:hypothetical protein
MSLEEQKCFLDLVDPQPEPEATKKASKKRGPRSSRASGMAAAIKNSIEQGKQASASTGQKCTAMVPELNVVCGNTEDNGIHDPNGGYGGYHEFEGPKSKKAAAQK